MNRTNLFLLSILFHWFWGNIDCC